MNVSTWCVFVTNHRAVLTLPALFVNAYSWLDVHRARAYLPLHPLFTYPPRTHTTCCPNIRRIACLCGLPDHILAYPIVFTMDDNPSSV